jgi:NADH:ubiquinone reductase (H+-translocating)
VIVGGGFAGLTAARTLRATPAEVVLLDRNLHNTFQPLLYQVASGGLNPGDVTYSLRAFAGRFGNVRYRRAAVTGVDAAQRRVALAGGGSLAYDYLILAPGVTPNYFGVPGAAAHSSHIYTRNAAVELRDRLLGGLETLAQDGAGEAAVVVVGGGAVGVEMAGALADLRNTALPLAYPELHPSQLRIVLVELTAELLAPFVPALRAYTLRQLRRRGVEVRLGTSVVEVRRDRVLLSDGEVLPSVATVWATGVTADAQVSGWGLPQTRGGRIAVAPDLRVLGQDAVFAVGDVAAREDEPLPQLAQPAIQGGRHAARQVRRLLADLPTEPFTYRDKGIMATVGRNAAVVQFPWGLRLRGPVAWLAWVALHIVTLMSHRNRLATLANLAVRYVSWKRSANVIVGDPR